MSPAVGSSVTASGTSHDASFSSDGRYVAFLSTATDLVPGQVDLNGQDDVFLFDRLTGATTLVTRATGTGSTTANGYSIDPPALSADGRFVAFASTASNLLTTPLTTIRNVFLFDRTDSSIRLVSHAVASSSTSGDSLSSAPTISADGEAVAFYSYATNLVSGTDANQEADVFLYTRSTGEVVLVSHAAGAATNAAAAQSYGALISSDAERVVFTSRASDLTPSPVSGLQIYSYDTTTRTNTLISHAFAAPAQGGNGNSQRAATSADGKRVAFISQATDLVSGTDTNDAPDIFLYDTDTGLIALVSHAVASLTMAGDDASSAFLTPAISADGEYVSFTSTASNLLAGGTAPPVYGSAYLYQRSTGAVSLVSHTLGSTVAHGNDSSREGGISGDGRYVAFLSLATDLTGGQDAVGSWDVFLYDRQTTAVSLVSHALASSATGNGPSDRPRLPAGAGLVLFESQASDLVSGPDLNGNKDLFVHDIPMATKVLVSQRAPGAPSGAAGGVAKPPVPGLLRPTESVSADGRYAVFTSTAGNLIAGQLDSNGGGDVFLFDSQALVLKLVSHIPGDELTTASSASWAPTISRDGQFVAFASAALDLGGVGGSPFSSEIWLYEVTTGTIRLVSHYPGQPLLRAGLGADRPVVSADGAYLTYDSPSANLVAGATGFNSATPQQFLYSRQTDTTSLVTHSAGSALVASGGSLSIGSTRMATDTGDVVFASTASDLVVGLTGASPNVFLYDRNSGVNVLVSHAFGSQTSGGDGSSGDPAISDDGWFIAYSSAASNLTEDADNRYRIDLFLYERATGKTVLVSRGLSPPDPGIQGHSTSPALSSDGSFLAFESFARDLISAVSVSQTNVYLYSRPTRSLILVSHRPDNRLADEGRPSTRPWISANGRYVAFDSEARSWAGSDLNGARDVYLYSRFDDDVTLVSHRPDDFTRTGDRSSHLLSFSADGRYVSFVSDATDLTSADSNNSTDAFLFGPTGPSLSAADLMITHVGPALAMVDSEVRYSTTVTNQGPADALDVAVVNPTPAGVSYVSNAGDCAGPFPCVFATIPAGQSRSFDSRFQVPLFYTGPDPMVNLVRADAANPDPNLANNHAGLSSAFNPPSGPLKFHTVPPCRLADTRKAPGVLGGPALVAGTIRAFPVTGACGIPPTARQIAVNVTVTGADAAGHLRLFRAGTPLPLVSTLNYSPGQTRANSATLGLSSSGAVSVYCGQAMGSAHVILDLTGYYE
jgi:uncharacterized repeat protein (TIGR01451 family)